MSVKPQPYTVVCNNCGWRKRCAPRSDVLMPEDYVSECQKCGSEDLKRVRSNLLDAVIGLIQGL